MFTSGTRRIGAMLTVAVAALSVAGATIAGAAPEQRGDRRLVRGVVAHVADTGFTVQMGRSRSVEVTTSSTTTYRKIDPAVVADAAVGSTVRARGTRSAPGTLAAHAVEILVSRQPAADRAATRRERQPSAESDRGQVVGRVVGNDGSTLTVATRAGETVTVTTSSSTRVVRVAAATAADVVRGTRVAVHGSGTQEGFAADRVEIGAPARERPSRS